MTAEENIKRLDDKHFYASFRVQIFLIIVQLAVWSMIWSLITDQFTADYSFELKSIAGLCICNLMIIIWYVSILRNARLPYMLRRLRRLEEKIQAYIQSRDEMEKLKNEISEPNCDVSILVDQIDCDNSMISELAIDKYNLEYNIKFVRLHPANTLIKYTLANVFNIVQGLRRIL